MISGRGLEEDDATGTAEAKRIEVDRAIVASIPAYIAEIIAEEPLDAQAKGQQREWLAEPDTPRSLRKRGGHESWERGVSVR